MAGLITQSFIDDLLNRTDIVEIIDSRVALKKTGKNYSACCPFHQEKTPSFSVSPDKQFYHCFGCGAGGNALTFLMEHDHLEFPEAVEELARRAGVEVEREAAGSQSQTPKQPKTSPLYGLLEQANEFYKTALRQHPARQAAINYLKQRGLSGLIARDFAIGLAPPGWDNLSKALANDESQRSLLIEAGLVVHNPDSQRSYDRFRDRIMFPIRDSRGRIIGFGGRVLGDDKPKYLNSPETPVFHKNQELYGLYEARQYSRNLNEIIVVEGYMDVIALAQQGLRNAVATLGTATSEEHIKRLFRLVPTIIFCFDGDQAGRKAAWRALEASLASLTDGRYVRFLFLPEGQDPDTMIRQEGLDSFKQRLNLQAQSLSEYFFQHLQQEADPSTPEGKSHLAALANPLIAKVASPNLQLLLQQQLQQLTGLPMESSVLPATGSSIINQHTDSSQNELPSSADYHDYSQYWQASQEMPAEPTTPQRVNYRPRASNYRAPSQKLVDPPEIMALRALLHRPELAQKLEQQERTTHADDFYGQLLLSLLSALQKKPELTSFQLIARWHGTEQGRLLKNLAEKEWLISDESLEQLFFDTINQLSRKQEEQRLNQLLLKSFNQLSADEKNELRTLLERRASFTHAGPNGNL